MKKVCRYLKLIKLKSGIQKESWEKLEGNEFIVIFQDGTTEHCITKYELYNLLEKDHIKPIRYTFDMTDRIAINRDIIINIDEID